MQTRSLLTMPMPFRRIAAFSAGIFLVMLCACPTIATAQSGAPAVQTFRAGLKSIAIPPPTSNLVEIGPDYRVLFETFAPDTNRLVAAFVLSGDLPTIRSAATTGLTQYALVEVPRRAEFADITPDIFKQITGAVAAQFGGTFDGAVKQQEDDLNRRLKELNNNATTLNFDKPVQLGTLFSKSDACGFGTILAISGKGATTKMAMGLIVTRVQNRVVFAYLYTVYKDEDTVKWLKTTAEEWADAIEAANK